MVVERSEIVDRKDRQVRMDADDAVGHGFADGDGGAQAFDLRLVAEIMYDLNGFLRRTAQPHQGYAGGAIAVSQDQVGTELCRNAAQPQCRQRVMIDTGAHRTELIRVGGQGATQDAFDWSQAQHIDAGVAKGLVITQRHGFDAAKAFRQHNVENTQTVPSVTVGP